MRTGPAWIDARERASAYAARAVRFRSASGSAGAGRGGAPAQATRRAMAEKRMDGRLPPMELGTANKRECATPPRGRSCAQGRFPVSSAARSECEKEAVNDECQPALRTLAACGPFGPSVTSYSTFWPSARLRKPSAWIAVWWTNTSLPPPSGVMKPNPFASLNHFTVPVAIDHSHVAPDWPPSLYMELPVQNHHCR